MNKKFFQNSYISFSHDNTECVIYQRLWILGLVIILSFSPGLYYLIFDSNNIYIPLWIWLIFFVIYFSGIYLSVYYQKTFFNTKTGNFKYEIGLIIPIKIIEGNLKDIDKLEIYSYINSFNKINNITKNVVHTILSMHYKEKRIELIFEKSPSDARKLAVFIGCPLVFTGTNKKWGINTNYYIENLEEINKNLST